MMTGKQELLAHLQELRAAAVDLLRAKLDALAREIQEATSRVVADMDLVLPSDPEVLFPLSGVQDLVVEPKPEPTFSLTSVRELDSGRAQSEVLQGLLRASEPYAGGRAVLVFRDGKVMGWSGAGFDPEAVRRWQGAIEVSKAFSKVAAGQPVLVRAEDDALLREFLRNPGASVLLVPMSLRGKVVGVFLAEEGADGLAVEWLQLYTYLVGLQLETISVRPTAPTPALGNVEDLRPAQTPQEPPLAFEEAAPPPQELQAFAVPVPPEPAPVAPEPAPVAPKPAAVPTEAAAAMPAPTPSPAGEASLSATQRLEVTPVMPPRSAEEERKHEQARRFAKLLVSEIRLYNEHAVQEGKANRDIYARLKEDIDRSREMYEQRIPAEVRAVSDYFYEELVRTLADGDPDALGL